MTALDLVTAYAVIPGREDVALFLEEAMRGEGWQNSKMVSHRKLQTERLHRDEKRQAQRVAVMDILGLSEHWWRQNEAYLPSDASSPESEDEGDDTKIFVRHNQPIEIPHLMRLRRRRLIIRQCLFSRPNPYKAY